MTASYSLTWLDEATDVALAFVTDDALDTGTDWNGFPAIRIPKWQAYLLDLLMGVDPGPVPSTRMEADGVDESDDVFADGLTWEAA